MKTTSPVSLAGSRLGDVRHVCAFFNSDHEEHRVLLPFIKDGFECGDRAVLAVNPGQHHNHLPRLAAAGIDAAAAQHSGQFELRTNTETNLRDGHFDQDRMLEVSVGKRQHEQWFSAQPHRLPHGMGRRGPVAHGRSG